MSVIFGWAVGLVEVKGVYTQKEKKEYTVKNKTVILTQLLFSCKYSKLWYGIA